MSDQPHARADEDELQAELAPADAAPRLDLLRQTVRAFQLAMRAEGIPEQSVEHVVNRVLYGDPHPGRRYRDSEQREMAAGPGVTIHVTTPAGPGTQAIREQYLHARAQGNPYRW